MARFLGSRCKKCRQLNFSVCGSERCALARRDTRPGMHPDSRRKESEFKKRLIEKQKLRFSYWVSERQFRNYVKDAFRKPGIPGETLLSLLERRLDNMVYRLGFVPTLLAARQLVVHGHVLVNGRKVDRPPYALKPGDVVSLKEKSKKMGLIEEGLARSPARPPLPYLKVDKENLKGTLTSIPERAHIPLEINEGLIIEHYTRYL
ncbi:MAG: 30S ribosomal protein S4 [Deltaproteobacteria bacterium RBG_16_49_23]|nr:MAG: 30S ribosomal protein S4 [Deltaproteobacteria bacterium RBG_16_49_23]